MIPNLQDRIKDLRTSFDNKIGERNHIKKLLREERSKLELSKSDLSNHEEAQIIIQQVAKLTQSRLEYHISELVSLILDSVFEDPYKLKLEFELKRGKSEANLLFTKHDQDIDPMSASGGGVVDVASFALRVCLWSLQQPRRRATMFMDEPFKHLSKDLREKAGEMIKEISKKLQLQIIIVTHDPALVENADRVFEVEKRGKYSKASRINQD